MPDDDNGARAIILADRLYAYGATREEAWSNFRRQIAGAGAFGRVLHNQVCAYRLTDEMASEIAECIAADAIRWEQRS
jgi:hypothetical protein